MPKFKKFNSREHIHGLAEAALQIQAEELIREDNMPDLETLRGAVAETRAEYREKIRKARHKNSDVS